MHLLKLSFFLSLFLTVWGLSPLAGQVFAAEPRIRFDIRSQSLPAALTKFAVQADVRLVYLSGIARRIRSPQVSGNLQAAEALSLLLKSTGLSFEFLDQKTVIIRSAISENTEQTTEKAITLLPLDEEILPRIEEIITTGSRISRQDFSATSPAVVIRNDDFFAFGNATYDELVNTLPQVIPDATANTNNSGPNDGSSTVNLRHLGASRTLVLFNGRRIVPTSSSGHVDLHIIPASLISQLEIVTGGGSSVYGSDAISGVINFVSKKSVSGLNIRGKYGVSGVGDAEEYSIGLTYGTDFSDGKGNIALQAGYSNRGSFSEADRNVSKFDPLVIDGKLMSNASNTIPGGRANDVGHNVILDPAALSPDIGRYLLSVFPQDNAGNILISNHIRFDGDGRPLPFNAGSDRFLTTPFIHLQDPLERANLSAISQYDLTDRLSVYGEVIYMFSRHERSLSPAGMGQLFVPENSPFISPEFREILNAREGPDADNYFSLRTRILAGGPRKRMNERHFIRLLSGVKGNLRDTMEWDVFFNYGRMSLQETEIGSLSFSRFQSALGCPAKNIKSEFLRDFFPDDCPLVLIFPDGTRINPFGSGNITPDQVSFLQMDTPLVNETVVSQFNMGATIDGDGPSVFGKNIGFSLGLEYRLEESSFVADQRLSNGDIVGSSLDNSERGQYDVWEAFGEIAIPLVDEGILVKKMDILGGVRLSKYSTVGSVVSARLGIGAIVSDGLTLRADFQRAIRAPNINELFLSRQKAFPDLRDPCVRATGDKAQFCTLLGVDDPSLLIPNERQVQAFFSGNSDLEEERSNTITAGILLQPIFLPNASLSIDYFKIEIGNAIDTVSVTSVAEQCLDSLDVDNIFCRQITRDATGNIFSVENSFQNIANIKTNGLDFNARYIFDLESTGYSGRFEISSLATWLHHFEQQSSPLKKSIDCAGFVDRGLCGRAVPKLKINTQFHYRSDKFDIFARWRWISSVKDGALIRTPDADLLFPVVGDQHYFDLSSRVKINRDVQVTFGINNFFDNEPPFIESEIGAGTDPATYDTRGRFFFLSLMYRI